MNALDFMDRPIAFHRAFVTITKSVNAALMLSQAIYWSKRTAKDNDGWFYKSIVDWEKETGLTRHEQLTARRLLGDILEEKLAGMPATTHFRVTSPRLREWLGNNSRSSSPESGKQASRKAANKSAGKQQTTNSTESTSESTSGARRAKSHGRESVTDYVNNLKTNAAYAGIDIDREVGKMQAWLDTPRGRGRKLTRGFILNWLNKIDAPLDGKHESKSGKPSVINASNSNRDAVGDY
jgi:hypothetical protein